MNAEGGKKHMEFENVFTWQPALCPSSDDIAYVHVMC